jgi:hypothetical protein
MTDIKQTIKGLEDRRYKAMCEADAGVLDSLLADTLVYTHSYGGADTKKSYMDGIRSKKWQYQKIERPKEHIEVYGEGTVVVSGQVRIELLSDGKPKTLNSAFTNVWIKGARGWQMVAWQSTPLAT